MYSKQQIERHKTYTPPQQTNNKFVYNAKEPVTSQEKFIQQLSQYLVVTNTGLALGLKRIYPSLLINFFPLLINFVDKYRLHTFIF